MAEGELGEFIFDLEGAKRPPHTHDDDNLHWIDIHIQKANETASADYICQAGAYNMQL